MLGVVRGAVKADPAARGRGGSGAPAGRRGWGRVFGGAVFVGWAGVWYTQPFAPPVVEPPRARGAGGVI